MGISSSISGEQQKPVPRRPSASETLEQLRNECRQRNLSFSPTDTASQLRHRIQASKPSIWKMANDSYEELVNAIIRPPRAQYTSENLGRPFFKVDGRDHVREDFFLTNDRNLKIQCSWWKERQFSVLRPCVIYLHGNSSCRVEAGDLLMPLLQSQMSVLALDFSGSGQSDGEYVSLGYFETMDLKLLVEHLRHSNQVSTIALWGRSMGAVTALMYAEMDPSVSALICDSPFSSLRVLAKELVESAQLQVPKFAVGLGLRVVRMSVKSRAKFDINVLEPIENCHQCFVPCLFACAESDHFVLPHHARDIHAKYGGDKNIISFPGDHNSPRPRFFRDSAIIFLQNAMVVRGSGNGGAPADHTKSEDDDNDEERMLQKALLLSLLTEE